MVQFKSRSASQTESIASELARTLKAGQTIALYGDLGAGKTQFVRGLVRGLGGNPKSVSSPTFVLLNIYDTTRLTVYHIDAYRVCGEADLEAIGFSELLEQGGIVVVEWADRIPQLLPPNRIDVQIEIQTPRSRTITVNKPQIH